MGKNTFEENLENLDKIIESLENGELSLDDAIKEYESAMKLIKSSSKILNEAEGKLLKVIEKRDSLTLSRVGLVSKPFLVLIILFLASPAIILILSPT